MFNNANFYWIILGYILCFRHYFSFRLCNIHLPRCELRLIDSKGSCKQGFHVFRVYIYTRRAGSLLWILYPQRDLACRGNPFFVNYHYSFPRIRLALGSDVLLSGHGYYQSTILNPLCGVRYCNLDLGGFLRQKRFLSTILRPTLSFPFRHCVPESYPHFISP